MFSHLNREKLEKDIAFMVDQGAEFSYAFLDPETGEIIRIHDWASPEEEALPQAQKLLMLPTIPSQDVYLWMVEFMESCLDRTCQEKLRRALQQIGAQWKFRNVLYHAPEVEKQWTEFYRARTRAFAREWILSFLAA